MARNPALSVVQAFLVLLCAGHAVAEDSTGIPIDGKSFKCLSQMTKVKHFYVDNLLGDLAQVMSDASICGLGQAASNPMKSVIKYFPEDLR